MVKQVIKSGQKVVRIFDKHYGGPLMDEIADYTTPRFRDNKPKAVWVAETSKSLNAIKYERLNSAIIDSRVKGNRAVIILKARINTMCGPLARNETYYLPYYYLGLINYSNTGYELAEYYYQSALQMGANPALTYYALGVNAYAAKLYEEADNFLNLAKASDPDRYGEKVDKILERIKAR